MCPPPGAAAFGFATVPLPAPAATWAALVADFPVPDMARGGGGSMSFPVRARLDAALSPSASFLLVPGYCAVGEWGCHGACCQWKAVLRQ